MKIIKCEFSKFLVAGGLAALANLGSRFILSFYLDFVPSIIISYIIGMIIAYNICRRFVFQSQEKSQREQISYFTAINIFAVVQTVVISWLFANYFLISITDLSFRETIAHFIGVCFPVITSYFGHKYVTFR